MVHLSVEASEVGWDWVRASSSGECSAVGSEQVSASPQELESAVSLGLESEATKEAAMGAWWALTKEREWGEASEMATATVLEQAWELARAPTSAPSMEEMSEKHANTCFKIIIQNDFIMNEKKTT